MGLQVLASPLRANGFNASLVANGRVFVRSANALLHGALPRWRRRTTSRSPYQLLRTDAGPQPSSQYVLPNASSGPRRRGARVRREHLLERARFASVDIPNRTVSDWEAVPQVEFTARPFPMFTTYKSFLYVLGGWDVDNLEFPSAQVDVAPLDGQGRPGPFVAAEPMANSLTGQPHRVAAAVVTTGVVGNAGQLFVIGGVVQNTFEQTNVVVSARIRESDGTLAPWVTGPPLPSKVDTACAVVFDGRLYVLGGVVRDLDAGQRPFWTPSMRLI